MGQKTTWKETHIEFKKYEDVSFEQTSTKFNEIFFP